MDHMHPKYVVLPVKMLAKNSCGTWQAQSLEHAPLHVRAVSLIPTSGIEIT